MQTTVAKVRAIYIQRAEADNIIDVAATSCAEMKTFLLFCLALTAVVVRCQQTPNENSNSTSTPAGETEKPTVPTAPTTASASTATTEPTTASASTASTAATTASASTATTAPTPASTSTATTEPTTASASNATTESTTSSTPTTPTTPTTSATPTTPTSTATTTTQAPCLPSGYRPGNDTKCQEFIECATGQTLRCPNGLVFDSTSGFCNVGDSCPSTTTEASGSTTSALPQCLSSGYATVSETNCMFIDCSTGSKVKCPGGMFFDVLSGFCDVGTCQ